MSFVLLGMLLVLALFAVMLAAAEAGRRIGVARLARSDGLAKGGGSADAATFALLGLLIAFTFSGAASRFQDRRDLIADEANAIGTAYLRLDLLPSEAQSPLRELFRRYVDVRATVCIGKHWTTRPPKQGSARARSCRPRFGRWRRRPCSEMACRRRR